MFKKLIICVILTKTVVDACPPNSQAYIVNGQTPSCDPFNTLYNNCPVGYSCQYEPTFRRYQCCTTAGVVTGPTVVAGVDSCPKGQIEYRDAIGSVRQCALNSQTNTCPFGYFCQYSRATNRYHCCGTNGGCPNRQVAFIWANGLPQQCTPGVSLCPTGYTCNPTIFGTYVCCLAITSGSGNQQLIRPNDQGCGINSGSPYLYRSNTGLLSPLRCTGSSCPSGFICRMSLVYGYQLCCPF